MRILMLGVGATGGYFGARLVEAGGDVAFLVRPARKAALARDGLRVESPAGNFNGPVRAISLEDPPERFDVAILSCKAYDLDAAIVALRPHAEGALIVPILNGMGHLDALDAAFGRARVMGGLCRIGADRRADGTIVHFNEVHSIVFGDREGRDQPALTGLAELFARSRTQGALSPRILLEMWDKWAAIATHAAVCALMRAAPCDVAAAPAGVAFAKALSAEVVAIARACGGAPSEALARSLVATATDPKSDWTASLLRDVERGLPAEGDHLIGDMLRRGRAAGVDAPMLALADAHLQAYEARRRRVGAVGVAAAAGFSGAR